MLGDHSPDFQQLVRQFSGQRGSKLSSMLLDHVDFPALQQRLVALILDACSGDSCEEQDTSIVEYCLGLWLGCVIDKQSLLEDFLQGDERIVEKFVLKGLFCATSEQVRVTPACTLHPGGCGSDS